MVAARVLVLDTNVYRWSHLDKLARLADRGDVLRVAETSLYECLARSVEDDDRGALFNRARAVAGLLDPVAPIALGGANLTRRIVATVDGRPLDRRGLVVADGLQGLWRSIVSGRLTDDQWRDAGRIQREALDGLDKAHAELCLNREIQVGDAVWRDVPVEDARRELRAAFATHGLKADGFDHVSEEALERIDGNLLSIGFRVYQAKKGARTPKKNDGVDASLALHIGEGCFVVTNDGKMIDLIDESRTYQAPWVRSLDDLGDLPGDPPWGAAAREVYRSFRRRKTSGGRRAPRATAP
ncbi:MAG TPA: hypothetical protein VGL81_31810 [Polyangiaceae bacterium]|jgi:hypothetical protein